MMSTEASMNQTSMTEPRGGVPDDAPAPGDVVENMDIVPLTMSLVQLTGDASLLDGIAPHVRGAWDHSQSVPADTQAALRARMASELQRLAEGGRPALPELPPDLMRRMLAAAVGETVSDEYLPLIQDQMSIGPVRRDRPFSAAEAGAFRVAIVGSGVSGIGAAIKLKEAGIAFTIVEKNRDVGGTWFENTYPGCAVDTPNHFYQFSFEPNNDWPRYYSSQRDNLDYLKRCVDRYGIRDGIRFSTEVREAVYDETDGLWRLVLDSDGRPGERMEANAVIWAVGQLNRPAIPNIPGLAEFGGTVVHTAAWKPGLELGGKRVALVGSGASAVQVGCAIAPEVERLTILQRSGSWIVRSPNVRRTVSDEKRWALHHVPFYAAWYRFQLFWGYADGLFPALRVDPAWEGGRESINAQNAKLRRAMVRYITEELADRPDLIEKAVPDYPPYGKRVLADPGWFRMLKRPNVELVTDPIERIESEGIRLRGGRSVPVDVIVMATGFQAGRMLSPMSIVGRGGVTIRDVWGDDDPRAYLGITVPDFPNMFVLYGPNTGLGHGGSFTFLAECQIRYTMGCIRALIESRGKAIEVTKAAFERYNDEMDRELTGFVWAHPSVRSWYRNERGRVVINQPWKLIDYWTMTSRPDLRDYAIEPAGAPGERGRTQPRVSAL